MEYSYNWDLFCEAELLEDVVRSMGLRIEDDVEELWGQGID